MKKSRGSGMKSGSTGKMSRSSSMKSRPGKSSGGGLFRKRSSGKTPGMSGGPKIRPSGSHSDDRKDPHAHGGHKSHDDFVKPPHDPGPKTAEEIAGSYGQPVDDGGSGGGGGCCASVSSLMTIIVIGVIIVVVIFVLKCTSCF